MSLFTYIFFSREIEDKNYVSNSSIYNISYEKADSLGYIPWFVKWNENVTKKEYPSVTLFKRGNNEGFPFVMNFFAYAIIENTSEVFTQRDVDYHKRSFGDKALDAILEDIVTDSINRHQLYHLINDNIKNGESVEIYSQWLDWDMPEVWGPPEHIYELSLKEIFDNRRFSISTEKNDLYIIHKL